LQKGLKITLPLNFGKQISTLQMEILPWLPKDHLKISFSESISLKKSFIRVKTGNLLLPKYPPAHHEDHEVEHQNSLLVSENNNLKEQIKELQTSYKSSKETIKIL
jgi:hypothetical protein